MASSSVCARGEGVLSLPGDAGRGASGSRPEASRPGQRFPRASRLTSRRQFLQVYAEGRRAGSPSFTLFGLPNDAGTTRLGITVTRRIGGAVRRNRIKRVLRDLFRRHRDQLTPTHDLVINVHRSFDDRDAAVLERELLAGFARLARRART